MPFADAFAYLVSLKPELQGLVEEAIAHSSRSEPAHIGHLILGPGADARDPILNTDFAVNLVNDYIRERTGRSLPGQDLSTPFFDRTRLGFHGSFFPFGVGDSRPRARN
jgi:hypothetical protein